MRKIQVLLFIVFVIVICASCSKTTETTVKGKIENLDAYPTTKTISVSVVDFRGKKSVFTDSIKPDGSFEIVFDLYSVQDVKVDPIVGKIIARPGDVVEVGIDFKDIANIKFYGDGKKSNKELNIYLNSNYCIHSHNKSHARHLSNSDFKTYSDSIRSNLRVKRDAFISEYAPTKEIQKWTKDFIDINYYNWFFDYLFKKMLSNRNLLLSEITEPFDTELNNINSIFNSEIINTDSYNLLSTYMRFTWSKVATNRHFTHPDSAKLLLKNHLLEVPHNDLFKEYLLAYFFYVELNRNNIDVYKENNDLIEQNIQTYSIKTPLTNYYNSLEYLIENPEIRSNSFLTKMDSTSAEDLLDSIINQNKGKVIYIDIWATWCGPCLKEMPYSKKLKKQLDNEDVKFVFLCINSTKELWKLNISQIELEGEHIFCDKIRSRAIRMGLGISGIPHYILINKQGHITESGSYLRPSDVETLKKIEVLLDEK